MSDIIKAAPIEHQDKLKEQFATVAVMDVVTNNGDRHMDNLLIDTDSHSLIPIDHGTAFGNGMQGTRNDIAMQFYATDTPLSVPKDLHTKLKNQSMDATFRSLEESGLPDWAKAQTFLRQQYVVHLQDKFGHIPYDRIRPTVTSRDGAISPYVLGQGKVLGWEDGIEDFFDKQGKNQLPHQQFDGFAKAWLEERLNNPEHPQHQDAKRLAVMQPIRASKHVTGAASEAELSKHYESIPAYDLSEPGAASASKKTSEPLRTPPEAPNKTVAPKRKKNSGTEQLTEDDLEEVSPVKYSPQAFARTELSLDLSDFNNDADIDAAFDRIQQKKSLVKSLYLANPSRPFKG